MRENCNLSWRNTGTDLITSYTSLSFNTSSSKKNARLCILKKRVVGSGAESANWREDMPKKNIRATTRDKYISQPKRRGNQPLIVGSGIVLYKVGKGGEMSFLMSKTFWDKKLWEDLGGKFDDGDNAYKCATRECEEESNGLISQKSLLKRIHTCKAFSRPPYKVFFIEATPEEASLTTDMFGNKEIGNLYDNERIVEWKTLDEIREIRNNRGLSARLSLKFFENVSESYYY